MVANTEITALALGATVPHSRGRSFQISMRLVGVGNPSVQKLFTYSRICCGVPRAHHLSRQLPAGFRDAPLLYGGNRQRMVDTSWRHPLLSRFSPIRA